MSITVTITQTIVSTVLAQVPTPAGPTPIGGASAAPANPVELNSIWDFIIKGGPVMFVIALCSLVALTIVIERAVVLRRRRVIPKDFVAQAHSVMHDRERALGMCRTNPSPIARVLEAAVKSADLPSLELDRRVEETGQREVAVLRHRMRLLSALPQVATLLGLLGTVFGMIKTFQVVAVTSQALGKTESLAKGIFEAWTCTAAGLLVAIVVLVAYQMLMGKIDALVNEIDRVAADWLEQQRAGLPGAVTTRSVESKPLIREPSPNGSPTVESVPASA